MTEETCLANEGIVPTFPLLHDCRQRLREFMDTVPVAATFSVRDELTGFQHRIETNTPRQAAQEFHVFNQVLTGTLSDHIWHRGVTCPELDDDLPHYNPCGVVGGCCFGDCIERPNTHGCLPYRRDLCERGWRLGRANLGFAVIGVHDRVIFEEGCAFRKPLNDRCSEIVPTSYTGDNVLCQCSFTTSPFIADELRAVGFDSCVLLPQDERTWEEGCAELVPPELFPCRSLGTPLVIDDNGFAVFDFGNKLVSPAMITCVDVIGDLYVDPDGVAHALACFRTTQDTPTSIAIADFHHDWCAAMYGDYRWDSTHRC